MPSRGLPGFIRRTLRVDYEEDDNDADEEADDDDVIGSGFDASHGNDHEQKPEEDSLNRRPKSSLLFGNGGKQKIFQPEAYDGSEHEETIIFSPAPVGESLLSPPTAVPRPVMSRQSSGDLSDSLETWKPPPVLKTEPGNIFLADSVNRGLRNSEHSIGWSAGAALGNSNNQNRDGDYSQSSSMSLSQERGSKSRFSDSWQEEFSRTANERQENPTPSTDKKLMSYKEIQFEKVISAPVVNMSELRKLGWNGIPAVHRGMAWKIMLGYLPTNQARRQQTLQRKRAEYKDAMAQHYDIDDDTRTLQEQETLRQVLVDVPRTAPDIPLFRNDRVRRILSRLLYIWAMRHPASSYVQGINDLATPLLTVFLADYFGGQDVLDGHVMNHLSEERLDELEADVYWCLTNLLAGIQDHYTSDQPGVQRMVMRLEELVNRIDGDLCRHFREMGIEFLQLSFRWMNCLLLREFHLRSVIRLWDTYISEKDGFEDFHVYVCAAFLCQFSPQLQEMNFDELFGFMQEIPTGDWGYVEVEMLLSQAFVLSTLFAGSDAHLTSGSSSLSQQR